MSNSGNVRPRDVVEQPTINTEASELALLACRAARQRATVEPTPSARKPHSSEEINSQRSTAAINPDDYVAPATNGSDPGIPEEEARRPKRSDQSVSERTAGVPSHWIVMEKYRMSLVYLVRPRTTRTLVTAASMTMRRRKVVAPGMSLLVLRRIMLPLGAAVRLMIKTAMRCLMVTSLRKKV
jgi:hypothetical protein